MKFCRFIKPLWAKPKLKNGLPNPDFIEEIEGPDVFEGLVDDNKIKEWNEKSFNCYFLPNHPSEDIYADRNYASARDIDVFNVVFVDYDSKDNTHESIEAFLEQIKKFHKPSLVVLSGNGAHVYWEVTGLCRESFMKIQFGLINKFKTDPSVYSILQLMRIPGTLNTKEHGNFKLSKILEENEVVYSVKDFDLEISEKQAQKVQRALDRLDGKITLNLEKVDTSGLPEKFNKLIESNSFAADLWNKPDSFIYYDEKTGQDRPDRSKSDYILGRLLRDLDYTEEECLQVLANTKKSLESSPAYSQYTVNKLYEDHKKQELKLENLEEAVYQIYGILL